MDRIVITMEDKIRFITSFLLFWKGRSSDKVLPGINQCVIQLGPSMSNK